MSASNTPIGFLNPNVYLNNIPPSEALQVEASRNINLVVLGATIWDILVYISDDVNIVRHSKFHFVVFCFIFSRLAAVIYVLVDTIERVMPVDDLRATLIGGGTLCMLSVITSSYLFLQRIQAIYAGDKWIRRIFFVLWVVLSASHIVIPIGIDPSFIPGTRYYLDAGVPAYVALSNFSLLFFDTLVLIAISYKIASEHSAAPTNKRVRVPWRALVSGSKLPRFSRAVFRGGQQYYLITVGMTILVGISVSIPSIPQIFKTTFPTAMAPLTASMASRVFRNTKLFSLNPTFSDSRVPRFSAPTV